MTREKEELIDDLKVEAKDIDAEKNNNFDTNVSLSIKKRHIPAVIGIIGALVTVIACFMPLYTLSFFGMTKNVMYIEGDGVLVCVCAIIAVVLIFTHKQRFSVVPVVGEVLFLCHTVFLAKDILDFGGSYGAGLIVLILGILVSCVGIILAFIWKTDRGTKKGNIITTIVLTGLSILLVVVMIVGQVYENKEKYNQAIEQMNKGNYDDAIDLFQKLGDYEDSQAKLTESKYLKAKSYLADERYTDAKDIFEALGDYQDSADLVQACNFGKIKNSYWDSSDLPDTIDAIKEKCSDLKEAKEFVDEKIKEQLDSYDSYDNNEGALEFLNRIADKWDVQNEIKKYEKNIEDIKTAEEEAKRLAEEEASRAEEEEQQESISWGYGYADLAGRYWGNGIEYANVSIYSSPENSEIGNMEFVLEDGTGYVGTLYVVEDGLMELIGDFSETIYIRFWMDLSSNMATLDVAINGYAVSTMNQIEHWYS